MKPKTIDEILFSFWDEYEGADTKEEHLEAQNKAKQQLLDLFMSCVPPVATNFNSAGDGWNKCRGEMFKNLERLK